MTLRPRTPEGSADARADIGTAAPTLGFLCGSLGLRLAGEAPPRCTDRPVRGVWLLDGVLVLPDAHEDLRDLVVVPPGGVREDDPAGLGMFVRQLAGRGAAALAWPLDSGACGPPDGLTAAAARFGMPLLVVPEGVRRSGIAQAVSDERCRLAQAQAGMPGELLARLRTPSDRRDGVQSLVDWLARTVDGAVAVTAGTGAPVAEAPAGAFEIMEPVSGTIARVAARQLGSAAVDVGRWQVRLLPVGDRTPGPVLAVALSRSSGRSPNRAVGCAADVLPLLLRIREAEAYERRTCRVLSAARVGVLQMLMGGQLLLAQRTAAAVAPGLLDADQGRVLVLAGRPQDRDAAVEECIEAAQGHALVVRCPVYDTNVIIVAPARDRGPGHWEVFSTGLRNVVAARPDRCMGGSGLRPLGAAADAYREATHALAAARHLTERVVLHSTETPLVQVLDQRAHAWAGTQLGPILALHPAERDQMLDTLRLVLDFGVTGASRITGRHRNTVSATRKRAAGLLAADMGDVLTRARLDLALQVLAGAPAGAGACAPAALSDLLDAAPARYWAQQWLAALDQDARDLRRTLVAWIGCNTHVERAAARLRLYPDTVRDHLKAVDRLLQRDLMSASGPHDLVLALLAVGALPYPAGPEPTA